MTAPDESPDAPTLREPSLPLVLRRVLPAAVIAVMTVRILGPLGDPDTLWHILAGQRLLATGDFVQVDPYSPATTEPWILHQWLPELAMALLERTFGLPGVAWGLTLSIACIGLALWWTLRRRAGLLVTALIIIVAFVGMGASLSARPQVISFVLIVVVTGAWLRMSDDEKPRWWLIPLSWVWACSHGLWVVGPVVGIVTLLGMALERKSDPRSLGRLSLLPLASIAAALLTPLGPGLLASFVEIRQVAPMLDEWQPMPPTHPSFIAAGLLIAVPLLVGLRPRTGLRWPHVLLLVLAAGSILIYGRTVAVGAAIAAPITAWALQGAVRLRRERVRLPEVAITGALVAAALSVTAVLANRGAAEPNIGPTGLNTELAALPSGTVACNVAPLGGWLLWKHPHLRPTLDTRMEVYGADHLRSYITFVAARPGWQDYLTDTGCTVALLPTEAAVHEALVERRDWREIGRSDGYVLLEAPAGSAS